MGGYDYLISELFKKEIESHMSKSIIKKAEKRLFERYGITFAQSMTEFEKLEQVLEEYFGKGAKGMIRSILGNLCILKKSTGRADGVVTLHDPKLTEMVLDMLGDNDYRRMLDMLIGKSMTPFEILKKLSIPQASAYRKIDALQKAGLLVEDGKMHVSESGRMASRLTTLYRGLDVKITKNRVTVEIKLNRAMLAKSNVLCSLYSV